MAEKVLAAVRTAPSKTEIREYPMPDIPFDGALLKMEVGGICGTDVKLYKHPPTSIFIKAASTGTSGIGYSRISVLLGAVRTAASTFSAT